MVLVAVVLYGTLGPAPGDELEQVGEAVGEARDALGPVGGEVTAADDGPWPFGLSSEDVGNIAMFVPVPVLVALRWPRSWWAGVPLGVSLSGAIELTQRYVLDHRSPQWSDFAFNSAGVVVGFVLLVVGRWVLGRRAVPVVGSREARGAG